MIRAALSLGLSLLVIGCAAKPPEPPTLAQLAAPHAVLVDEPRPTVPVDINLDISRTAVIPLSPIGLIVAAAVTAGDAVVTGITVSNRTARRDELAALLGQTGPVAASFTQQFNARFQQEMTAPGMPPLSRFEQAPRGADIPPGEGAGLRMLRDLLLTTDGRFLVARATTMHIVGEGAGRRVIPRHFVAFSDPVEAGTEEAALARWTADDNRLMRDQAGRLAGELVSLIRLATFSAQPVELERATAVRIPTSGVSILYGTAPGGREAAFWMVPSPLSYELRRDASRVVTLSALGRAASQWTWISLPASLFPPGTGS